MDEDRSVLIEEEVVAYRDFCGKVRRILRVAMAKGTKAEYRQGCLAVLAIVDEINPSGAGFHVTRETFVPENLEHPGSDG